jgi:hypothetical protein
MHHKYHTCLSTTALHMSIGKDRSLTQPRVAHKAWICDEQWVWMKFWQLTPLFSNSCLIVAQRRTTELWHQNLIQIRGSSQILRSVSHSETVQNRENSGPSHLTCMIHVRHVGPKRVTHRFCYTTYALKNIAYETISYKTLHMKIK